VFFPLAGFKTRVTFEYREKDRNENNSAWCQKPSVLSTHSTIHYRPYYRMLVVENIDECLSGKSTFDPKTDTPDILGNGE
jgi:hypothetical protein